MKRAIASLMFAGLICAGGTAVAQERYGTQPGAMPAPSQQDRANQTTTNSTSSKDSSRHEMMKDCVAREQAGNSGMSKSEAKKACKDAMKAEKVTEQNERNSEHSPTTTPAEPR